MSRLIQSGLAAITFFCSTAAVHSQETVKIGAVQGLSGPPAIVDFGESYLQGNTSGEI
jgi:branched-chain amino acid transport system substrate-binding protein